MLGYMVNTFEQVYMSGITASLAEIFAYILSACLYARLGLKQMLLYFNLLSAFGGIVILIYGLQHQESFMFPCLIMLARFGVSAAFNAVFIGHDSLFPVLFASTSFGICNFLARSFTAVSTMMSQLEQPTPMIIFTLACSLAAISALFLVDIQT